jgi:endopolyphosphatase
LTTYGPSPSSPLPRSYSLQFFFLEADDLKVWSQHDASPEVIVTSSVDDLYDTLLHDFGALRKLGKKLSHDNFAVINVSPSVVPNPYLPSFRIFSYNITGAESRQITPLKRKHGHKHGGKEEKKCKGRQRKTWKCNLKEPWHSDPEAPSRNNTLWSPLGYAQVCMAVHHHERILSQRVDFISITSQILTQLMKPTSQTSN